ncbi:MAG: hypothetical protein FWF46_06410 [Oscillospiraceae bacterium]|nr:hypothetical protein [Oscillospiraceae bacterium]
MSDNYKQAYTEVLEVLKYMPEDTKKIPPQMMLFIQENQDKSYKYNFDINTSVNEQPMSNIAKAILANFYRDYIATPEEKEKILQIEKYEIEKYEEGQKEKYNPDNLFKTRQQPVASVSTPEEQKGQTNYTLPTEIKKTNIFVKLIKKLKSLFK